MRLQVLPTCLPVGCVAAERILPPCPLPADAHLTQSLSLSLCCFLSLFPSAKERAELMANLRASVRRARNLRLFGSSRLPAAVRDTSESLVCSSWVSRLHVSVFSCTFLFLGVWVFAPVSLAFGVVGWRRPCVSSLSLSKIVVCAWHWEGTAHTHNHCSLSGDF